VSALSPEKALQWIGEIRAMLDAFEAELTGDDGVTHGEGEPAISEGEKTLWWYCCSVGEVFSPKDVATLIEEMGCDDLPSKPALSMALIRFANRGLLTVVEKGSGRRPSTYKLSPKGEENRR
jgi:hypothetical protein